MIMLTKNTFLSLLVFIMLSIGLARPSYAMGLKDNAMIEGSVITLGDIFYDLPRDKGKVLGPSPRPGSDMVLNARTLMRIALALDLPWRPSSSNDYIVIKRAATVIGKQEIHNEISKLITEQGISGNFEIEIPNEISQIVLPQDVPATFEITDLKIDHSRNWLEAKIYAPSKENPLRSNTISGKMHRMVSVPVLRDTLRVGTIIGKNDIETLKMRENAVGAKVILSTNDLIGMTPRRIAFAGKPLTDNDIQAPQIIARGELITMVMKTGGMTLTAQGRSLENGAKGDIIRVVNTTSSRTIQGTISAENEITITEF